MAVFDSTSPDVRPNLFSAPVRDGGAAPFSERAIAVVDHDGGCRQRRASRL